MGRIARREFVRAGVVAACGLGVGGGVFANELISQVSGPLPVKKGLVMDMLPSKLSYAERFKLARDVGFAVVQAP